MGASLAFGCPECGKRIDLARTSSGRRVRCGRCGTLVEVPFFPRQIGRRRRRIPRWKVWLPVAVAALVALGGPTIVWQAWVGAVRAGHRSDLQTALTLMERAEAVGDLSAAFVAADEARSIALEHGLDPPGGLPVLASRRDELARQEVEARLESISSLPPARAVEESSSLASRASSDPALAGLADRASGALASASARWVDDQLSKADRAISAGRSTEAMAVLGRLSSGLDAVPSKAVEPARARVREFASGLIGRVGARIGPVSRSSGTRSGTEADADTADADADATDPSMEEELAPILAETLADRGYLVLVEGSPLFDLADRAPFRLGARVEEQPGPNYLQSANRSTIYRVDLALERQGHPVWSEHFEARTRSPLPGLSAMEGSRLALATRSLEYEARFRRDAQIDLVEKLRLKLKALPPAPASAPTDAAGSCE